jgi:hypothetical protein
VLWFIWTYWAARFRGIHQRGPFEVNLYAPVHKLQQRQTTDGPVLVGRVTLGNITRGVYGSTLGNVTALMNVEGYAATMIKRSDTGETKYDEDGRTRSIVHGSGATTTGRYYIRPVAFRAFSVVCLYFPADKLNVDPMHRTHTCCKLTGTTSRPKDSSPRVGANELSFSRLTL